VALVASTLGSPRAYVLLDDAEHGDVIIGASHGGEESVRSLRLPPDLMRDILSRGEEAFVLSNDEVVEALAEAKVDIPRPPSPIAVAPLSLSRGRLSCILVGGSSTEHEFSELDLRMLAGMAHQASLLLSR